nr:hypothetical protein CFP56_25131 [Quercus suber]
MGDGLGGATKLSQPAAAEKPPVTAARKTGEDQVRSEFGEMTGADLERVTITKMQDSGAHFTQTNRDISNPILKDLDLAIEKYDSNGEHVVPRKVDTSQGSNKNGKQLTPSLPAQHAKSQEQETHAIENTKSPTPANKTLRTWKRLARETDMETDTSQGPTVTKRSREEVLEYLLELPTKKLQDHPRVLSDMVPGFEDGRVSDLINPITRTWDSNLVHRLLSPDEAALVLSIPLSCTPVVDKIIWPFTPSGI